MSQIITRLAKARTLALLQLKYLLRYQLSRAKYKPIDKICGRASYAQAAQDLLVIAMHGNKRNGTYVEVGAQDPIRNNNSFLLERNLGWSGLSFELRTDYGYFFNRLRRNPCIVGDATQLNYRDVFERAGLPQTIDYLQVDIDPPSNSLRVIEAMPLGEYQFGVITFEHDSYACGQDVAQSSRTLLTHHGYSPVALDVCYGGLSFEDWWFHPDICRGPPWKSDLNMHGQEYCDIVKALLAGG